MHPPPSLFLLMGGGGGPLIKFIKRGGLTGTQFLEGVAWKERADSFQWRGGCSFYIKHKLKFEIFDDKKILLIKKYIFSLS